MLGELEKKILMELQYSFPLTPTPYRDVASRLGVDVDIVLESLRRLKEEKVLKRVGFYYNYRARGRVAALVALAAGDRYAEVARLANRDPEVSHNYLRSHPVYNVWIVVKRENRERIIEFAEELAAKTRVEDWVVLFGVKTLKLSVKYDLYEGVSRAGSYSRVAYNPPSPSDLGVPSTIPKALRSLPIEERPYKEIARSYKLSEEEVVEMAREMLDAGILGDPGAALDGYRLGFTENAMVVVRGGERACECAARLDYSTHVVLREAYPPGKWPYNCYFMVHATRRAAIERILSLYEAECGEKATPIYSLADLKPGAVR